MKKTSFDQALVLCLFFLVGIGIVQVYSASYIYAIENLNDGLYFFKKQLIFILVAMGIFITLLRIPWQWIEKSSVFVWVGVFFLLLASIYSPLAVKVNGASRWIQLPFFRLQPAELLKIITPLIWAKFFLNTNWKTENNYQYALKVITFLAPFVILLLQPDFGTFVICSIIIFGILFSFGLQWKYVFGLAGSVVVLFMGLIWMAPYRRARFMAFLDPWSDSSGSGFQVIQSMMSFHSGGLTGVGLGQGQGKLFFLPEAHTDFTFAVLAEETGFIGVSIIVFLFTYVIFKSMQIVIQTKDPIRKCVATGLTIGFAFQVFINMGVTMGILPTKGITLPFLSYGGSSLIGSALLFGILLNIRKTENLSKK